MAAKKKTDAQNDPSDDMMKASSETLVSETDDSAGLPVHHRISYLPLDGGYCEEHPSELEAVLQELNGLFSTVGVEFSVTDSVLAVDVNEEKFTSVTTRKAGRKSKDITKRYDEIMAYRETHSAMETAEWMGLTTKTYYRRIKELRNENSDGSSENGEQ